MKCPGCKFVCSDKKDICPQCLLDLRPAKKAMSVAISHPDLNYDELLSLSMSKKKKKRKKKNAAPAEAKKKSGLFSFLDKSEPTIEQTEDAPTEEQQKIPAPPPNAHQSAGENGEELSFLDSISQKLAKVPPASEERGGVDIASIPTEPTIETPPEPKRELIPEAIADDDVPVTPRERDVLAGIESVTSTERDFLFGEDENTPSTAPIPVDEDEETQLDLEPSDSEPDTPVLTETASAVNEQLKELNEAFASGDLSNLSEEFAELDESLQTPIEEEITEDFLNSLSFDPDEGELSDHEPRDDSSEEDTEDGSSSFTEVTEQSIVEPTEEDTSEVHLEGQEREAHQEFEEAQSLEEHHPEEEDHKEPDSQSSASQQPSSQPPSSEYEQADSIEGRGLLSCVAGEESDEASEEGASDEAASSVPESHSDPESESSSLDTPDVVESSNEELLPDLELTPAEDATVPEESSPTETVEPLTESDGSREDDHDKREEQELLADDALEQTESIELTHAEEKPQKRGLFGLFFRKDKEEQVKDSSQEADGDDSEEILDTELSEETQESSEELTESEIESDTTKDNHEILFESDSSEEDDHEESEEHELSPDNSLNQEESESETIEFGESESEERNEPGTTEDADEVLLRDDSSEEGDEVPAAEELDTELSAREEEPPAKRSFFGLFSSKTKETAESEDAIRSEQDEEPTTSEESDSAEVADIYSEEDNSLEDDDNDEEQELSPEDSLDQDESEPGTTEVNKEEEKPQKRGLFGLFSRAEKEEQPGEAAGESPSDAEEEESEESIIVELGDETQEGLEEPNNTESTLESTTEDAQEMLAEDGSSEKELHETSSESEDVESLPEKDSPAKPQERGSFKAWLTAKIREGREEERLEHNATSDKASELEGELDESERIEEQRELEAAELEGQEREEQQPESDSPEEADDFSLDDWLDDEQLDTEGTAAESATPASEESSAEPLDTITALDSATDEIDQPANSQPDDADEFFGFSLESEELKEESETTDESDVELSEEDDSSSVKASNEEEVEEPQEEPAETVIEVIEEDTEDEEEDDDDDNDLDDLPPLDYDPASSPSHEAPSSAAFSQSSQQNDSLGISSEETALLALEGLRQVSELSAQVEASPTEAALTEATQSSLVESSLPMEEHLTDEVEGDDEELVEEDSEDFVQDLQEESTATEPSPQPQISSFEPAELDAGTLQLFEDVHEILDNNVFESSVALSLDQFHTTNGAREEIHLLFDVCLEEILDPDLAHQRSNVAQGEKDVEVSSEFLDEALQATTAAVETRQFSLHGAAHAQSDNDEEFRADFLPAIATTGIEVEVPSISNRLSAFSIDIACVFSVAALVGFLIHVDIDSRAAIKALLFDSRYIIQSVDLAGIILQTFIVVLLLYPIVTYFFLKETIGQRFLKLELRRVDGRKAGLQQVVVKALTFPIALVFLGVLAPLFQKRPLHEWLSCSVTCVK